MSFSFNTSLQKGIQTIGLEGRLMDKDEAIELVEEVEYIISNGINKFVINLSQLEYMNSSGLNTLVSILTKARNGGGEVVIANVHERIQQLLVITKLNTVFTVAESVEAATEMLNQTIGES